MPIARVPSDVRDRTDLSLGDLERLVELRKARKKLQEKAARLADELAVARKAIEQNVADEASLLSPD